MTMNWLELAGTVFTAAIVNGLLLGMLLALAALAGMNLINRWRPINATTRFISWSTVMLLCIGLVVWQGWKHVPPSSIQQDIQLTSTAPAPMQSTTAVKVEAAAATPAEMPVVAAEVTPPNEAFVPGSSPGFTWPTFRIELPAIPAPVQQVLLIAWLLGASLLLLRVFVGWFAVRRLKARSAEAPAWVEQKLRRQLARMDRPRRVRVGLSDELKTAVAIGFLHPRILLPASMPATLSPTELEHVLLHEAAHIQRWDDWTILGQRIVQALFFFHPGILMMGRLMNREREFACDDWVLAFINKPKTYASCLAKLVTVDHQDPSLAFAPGFSSGKDELFERVKTILDRKRLVSFRPSRFTFILVMALLVAGIILTTNIDPVFAERDTEPVLLSEAVLAPVPTTTVAVDADLLPATIAVPEPLAIDIDAKVAQEIEMAFTSAPLASAGFADVPAQALPQPRLATTSSAARQNTTTRTDDPLSKRSMIRLIQSAQKIPASGDKAGLLIEIARRMPADPQVFEAFFATTRTVQSSGDKTRVLLKLIEEQALDSASAVTFLLTTEGIPSSGDKTRVLLASLSTDHLPIESQMVQDAFDEVLHRIPSSTDFRRVSSALLSRTRTQ